MNDENVTIPVAPATQSKTPLDEKNASNHSLAQSTNDLLEVAAWQRRLLPFMVTVLCVLTIFFFIASFVQLYYLHSRIERSPEVNLTPALSILEGSTEVTPDIKLDYARWKTLSMLEGNALERRYHQANVLLMSRIWTGYLGFVTGMILALVGATFILGKLRESDSTLSTDSKVFKVSLTSASPGLFLALLGTILMTITLLNHNNISVKDSSIYTSGWLMQTTDAQPRHTEMPAPSPLKSVGPDITIPTDDEDSSNPSKR